MPVQYRKTCVVVFQCRILAALLTSGNLVTFRNTAQHSLDTNTTPACKEETWHNKFTVKVLFFSRIHIGYILYMCVRVCVYRCRGMCVHVLAFLCFLSMCASVSQPKVVISL